MSIGRYLPLTGWSTSNRAPGRYRKGDCPIAEAMADVEFQVGGNYYLDGPELMSQIAAA